MQRCSKPLDDLSRILTAESPPITGKLVPFPKKPDFTITRDNNLIEHRLLTPDCRPQPKPMSDEIIN